MSIGILKPMTLVGNTHLIAGSAASIPLILQILKKEGIEVEANPDVYIKEYSYFGVDDARDLRERAQLSARGERRVFIVATTAITTEAQNALLKTFEEAPGDALFFLIVPSPLSLLPTIRSRAQELSFGNAAEESPIDAAAFLSSAPQKRLDMLKPLLEKGDDDKRDIRAIVAFLSALERTFESKPRQQSADGLSALYRARKYMGDKGALVKPLLEQLALLVPIMKA